MNGNCKLCGKEFKYSPSQKQIYCSHKCSCLCPEKRLKNSLGHKGKKHTEASRKKMSLTRKGMKQSPEWVEKRIKSMMANHISKTPEMLLIKTGKKYKDWRKRVFERDNYTCKECGDKTGGNLEAHHIVPFSIIYREYKLIGKEDYLYDLDNGLTLCTNCHKKTYSYARHISCNPEYKLMKAIRGLWEQQGKVGDFDSHYKTQMERFIDAVKEKLN